MILGLGHGANVIGLGGVYDPFGIVLLTEFGLNAELSLTVLLRTPTPGKHRETYYFSDIAELTLPSRCLLLRALSKPVV